MSDNNKGIALIEAAISNALSTKTALGYNEIDLKSLARFVLANWKYVTAEIGALSADLEKVQTELDATVNLVERVAACVKKQAEDEGCWFKAQTVTEAYLQRQLRLLHAAFEGTDFFGFPLDPSSSASSTEQTSGNANV